MAKSLHNPFEEFVELPIQATTGFGMGAQHDFGEALNVARRFPAPLDANWDLIAMPSLSAVDLRSLHAEFGLGDLQASFLVTAHAETTWARGAGPILQVRTATGPDFGTGRWSVGPTAAPVYCRGPWFNGVLACPLISFAGDRDRGSSSQTCLESDIGYDFDCG